MIDHGHGERPPETVYIFFIVCECQGFEQAAFYIVIVDLMEDVVCFVDIGELMLVAGIFKQGCHFDDVTGFSIDCIVFDVLVPVFIKFYGG